MSSPYRGPDPAPEFVRVAHVDDLPPGRMKRVQVDGRDLALMNLGGEFFAVDNFCPHNGGPLAAGEFDARAGRLVCPWHSWSWDVRSGQAISPPVKYGLVSYQVRVEGNDVLVNRRPG